MTNSTRWIIGLLLALVIGLAVGLAIVAGDDSEQGGTTTLTTEATAVPTTETAAIPTVPTVTDPSGGVAPP